MKSIRRYQSHLLPRRSYKPNRVIRITPTKLKFVFRPVGFGVKPKIKVYVTSCSSKAEHPVDNRATQEHYLPGRPLSSTGWCSQSARLAEAQEVSAQFRLQWPDKHQD